EGIYGFPQIVQAENYVIKHHLADVITQSFGAAEGTFTSPSQIYSLRSAYINAANHGVTVLAASGDQGSTDDICTPASGCANPNNVICCSSTPAVDWPSTDPLVTGVGGTQLHLNAQGQRTAPDSVWDDLSSTVGVTGPVYTWGSTGGGKSEVFSRPQFQNSVARAGSHSGIVPITKGTNTYIFCPVADTKSDSSCAASSDLVTVPGATANGAYNNATGWGTVNAAKFVPALAQVAGGGY